MLLCWIVVEWDCFVGLLLSVNVMRRWSFVVARARVWLHVHVVVCTCVVVVGCLHVCGCYV